MYGKSILNTLTSFFSFPFVTLLVTAILTPDISLAQVITEFGGSAARYKGDGDQEPPNCSLDIPKSASEPFFIKWDCRDNVSSPDELRSEVWLMRQGAQIPVKIADFLGFPASVKIEKGHLIDYAAIGPDEEARAEAEARPFESYLPIRFRMLVRDRAGVSALSPVEEVSPGLGLGSISSCSINLSTEPQVATLEITGMPALSAIAPSVPVSIIAPGSLGGSGPVFGSTDSFTFSVCEINAICESEDQFQLRLTYNVTGDSQALISSVNGGQSISAQLKPEVQNESSDTITLLGQSSLNGVPLSVGIQCN